ncbi:DUF4811 domain-containing protein [Lacticaseibacillus casei]|uniref:DUF4811 domain-containing protein n=1 Tax=Lacticaseibacillus TaxID=2759736 RepID=UPI0006685464|nr:MULTISPECIES: DUF4811 domain-containing protein [Lacticaseibacillus]QVI38290.1 DUF4811 domain-containing protein [Lacticaseibacillus casei]QXG60102.1 DUF4811 domain-containing protein [Lacticaseibacillus casei]WFB42843.1 DUF4811 domain-containing protein [Lacticaseibacillus huelsenbergensis]
MILWFLGLMVVGLYLSFIMMHRSLKRTALIIVFGIGVVGSLLLITLNDNAHFGMVKRTTTDEQTIYTASPNAQMPMLLKQTVGTAGKHAVYIYKTDPKKKAVHTKADLAVHNKVSRTSDTSASLTSKTTRWEYQNGFYGALFNHEGADQFVSQHNQLAIPKSWFVLTTTQAKQLSTKLKALQHPTAQQKAALATKVKAKAAELVKADPKLATDQTTLMKQAQKAVQQELIQQAVQDVQAHK